MISKQEYIDLVKAFRKGWTCPDTGTYYPPVSERIAKRMAQGIRKGSSTAGRNWYATWNDYCNDNPIRPSEAPTRTKARTGRKGYTAEQAEKDNCPILRCFIPPHVTGGYLDKARLSR